MSGSNKISAGLLMYRLKNGKPEIFLVHPGGPFWKNKDDGCWGIPKGQIEANESEFLDVAKREFEEETGFKAMSDAFIPLGEVITPAGKNVHAWAFEADNDPAKLQSNTCIVEWPPKSGKRMEIPEVDRGDYFTLEQARIKMSEGQLPFIERFLAYINKK